MPSVTLLVPIKAVGPAKSRLAVAPADRSALVTAMAEDVLAATRSTGLPVLVVTGGPDLDTALRVAAEPVRGPVAVVMADLPCVRPEALLGLLEAATGFERWVVADADGSGTALLGAIRGEALRPSYGPGSRARHAAEGADLTDLAPEALRRDVDTTADLTEAAVLGLGARTAAVHLGLP